MTFTTRIVLDLNALVENAMRVKQYAPQSKLMVVVKANAYGHGVLHISRALHDFVDGFAVARVHEGVDLRKITPKPIAVLGGFYHAEELEIASNFELSPIIHSHHQLDLLKNTFVNPISIWLKLDSGMNRLGFRAEELAEIYQQLQQNPSIKKIDFMTHFVNADVLDDDITQRQIDLFFQTVKNYPGEKSLANSAGILGWKNSVSDWVRAGLMLYGISPFSENISADFNLKPVMRFYSKLIAIKTVKQGESVGYGKSWICPENTKIGVISAGYGDGYPRHAKKGTPVLVNHQRAELVGNVSMDVLTVNLGKNSTAKIGDEVELWGENLPVEEIAQWANTIPYTLVCGITSRVNVQLITSLT